MRPRRPPAALERRLGFVLNTVAEDLMTEYELALRRTRLEPRTYALLAVLAREGPRKQATLAWRLGLDRTTASGLVRRLETAELVDRDRDPRDSRHYEVFITAAGVAACEQATEDLEEAEGRFLSRLSEGQRDGFARSVEALLPEDIPPLLEMLRRE